MKNIFPIQEQGPFLIIVYFWQREILNPDTELLSAVYAAIKIA